MILENGPVLKQTQTSAVAAEIYRNDPSFYWANSVDPGTVDQGLHWFPFSLHLSDELFYGKATLLKF